MSWAKFDDRYPQHPKVVCAGPLASLLNVYAILYCAGYNTDGCLPAEVVPGLVDWTRVSVLISVDTLVEALLRVGLWEAVDGGYRIHDFLRYQLSRQEVEQRRAEERARQQAAGRARAAHGGRDVSGRFRPATAPATHQPPAGDPAGDSSSRSSRSPAGHQPGPTSRSPAPSRPRSPSPSPSGSPQGSLGERAPALNGEDGARKGKQHSAQRRAWRTLPPGEELTPARRETASDLGLPGERIEAEWAKFADHDFSQPKRSVDRTWCNWVRRAVEWPAGRPARREPHYPEDTLARLRAKDASRVVEDVAQESPETGK